MVQVPKNPPPHDPRDDMATNQTGLGYKDFGAIGPSKSKSPVNVITLKMSTFFAILLCNKIARKLELTRRESPGPIGF